MLKSLTNGQPSTLGAWLDLCQEKFGKHSLATVYILKKIQKVPFGKNAEVNSDENAFLSMLHQLNAGKGTVNESDA